MAELGQKKQRNYVLDFWKYFACIMVALSHLSELFPEVVQYFGYYGKYRADPGFPFPQGFYTFGFFCITTGYWLVDAFKKYQRNNMFNKGNDLEILYRYAAKNWVGYLPLCFVPALFALIVGSIRSGLDPLTAIDLFFWDIWEFLGIKGLGFWQNVDGLVHNVYYCLSPALEANTPYTFGGVSWYPLSIIAFAPVFFTWLMHNEKLFLGMSPLLFATLIHSVHMTNNAYMEVHKVGIADFIGAQMLCLWPLAIAGMWLWYIVNALKKVNFTKKQENLIGWVSLFATVSYLVQFWFGFFGAQLNQDFHMWVIVGLTLLNKDWFTRGFNNVLNKMPIISKNFGDMGLGIYMIHLTLLLIIADLLETYPMSTIVPTYLGVCIVFGVIWVFINRYLIAPVQKKFSKMLGLTTPVGEMFGKKEEAPAEQAAK